jgi:hypothetical protein
MTWASLIVALVGALIVFVATVKQMQLNPDDPKYRIGYGTAATPPQQPLGRSYLGAPGAGLQVVAVLLFALAS